MKKFFLSGIIILIMLFAVGCSFNINEMGLPFIPTVTNTPLPTLPNTPTPTYPPKTDFRGGALQAEILENNTTLFTDPELGYQAVFAPEWTVVLADSPIEAQLKAAFGATVPESVSLLVNAAEQLPGIRMVGLDYTFKYSDWPLTYITLVFSPNSDALSAEMDEVLGDNIELVPTRMPGADVIYQDVQTNSSGLEYGKIILTKTDETGKFQIKNVVAIFKVSNGLLTLTGSASEETFSKLETVFQKAIDAIQSIE